MLDEKLFREKMTAHIQAVNRHLTALYNSQPLDAEQILDQYMGYARTLAPYVDDVSLIVYETLQRGSRVLAEGAQGTLLDIDQGTYPFVTSSSPTASGALVGLGIGPVRVDRVVGVVKAFQTRVGAGPFPTELSGEAAERLRGTGSNPWDEFGTTTGRPRRVGWLDLVLLRYAVRVNGLTELVLTKLDVLSGLDRILVCDSYKLDSETFRDLPFWIQDISAFTPVYETLPGWDTDISQARVLKDLPEAAQQYIRRIVDACGLPVNQVSVGPERDQAVII